MTAATADLLALAESLEKAAGPSWLLDCAVAGVIEWPMDTMPPPFTASLDAAMGLVPEGWSFRLGCRAYNGSGWCRLIISGRDPVDTEAATPALALCAAALRARAQEVGS